VNQSQSWTRAMPHSPIASKRPSLCGTVGEQEFRNCQQEPPACTNFLLRLVGTGNPNRGRATRLRIRVERVRRSLAFGAKRSNSAAASSFALKWWKVLWDEHTLLVGREVVTGIVQAMGKRNTPVQEFRLILRWPRCFWIGSERRRLKIQKTGSLRAPSRRARHLGIHRK